MFVNRKCLKAISSVKTKIFETIFRSSCLERFYKKGVLEKYSVLKNFTKFTGKHLCQSLFFNNVTGQGPPTLLKKSLWHRCFPVNFAKLLRTPIFVEHLRWLLLHVLNIYTYLGYFILTIQQLDSQRMGQLDKQKAAKDSQFQR